MDRNLGAMDTNNPNGGVGSVYYQFGRKDPFEGGTLYKPDGTKISISNIAWNSDVITTKSNEKGKNVPYSVQNPLKFITGSTWTTGDQYCPAGGGDFMWQDPKASPSADGKVKKSIFDPCPSGWMVPMSDTWMGVSNTKCVSDKAGVHGSGRYYYPDKATHPNDYIFYPANGYRDASNGAIGNTRDYGICSSCSPQSLEAYCFYYATINNYCDIFTTPRARGCPVRCIQEYF